MGRMHSKGKGMSSSALPYKRSPPSWLKTTVAEVRSIAGSDPLQQRRLDVARGLRGTVDDVEYGPSPTRKGQHEGRKDPERSRRSRDDSVSTAARARGERSSCPAFFVAAAGQKLPWLCRFSPCAEPGARCRRASYRSRRPKPSRDASFSLDVLFSHLLRSPPRSSSSTSSLPLKKKKKKNSGHRPDLQARQEGLHPLPDRRRAPGPAWRRPGRRSHQLQGAPHPQGIGPRPGDP